MLKIWQRARAWSKRIFHRAKRAPFCQDQRLIVQVNDSSESVMSNIAEGFGRGTQAEFVTFLGYALGSLDETRSHLCAAYDREYLDKDEFGELFQEGTEIRKMIVGFVVSMVQPGSGVKYHRKQRSWTEEFWERWERIGGQKRPAMWGSQGQEKDGTAPREQEEREG